jgi:hypothetical protein
MEPFYEWLNPAIHTWDSLKERGLRDDTPEEIKKDFQEYLDMREGWKRNHAK